MNDSIIELTYAQVGFAFVFVLIVLWILKTRNISREKELLLASVRMTIQLVLVGFLLTYIFENPHPIVTFSIILLMIGFAILTIYRKFKTKLSKPLKKVIAIALTCGGLPVLLYFMWVVVQVTPYYNPQYFIPITGMIIGNSMTGISLAVGEVTRRFGSQTEEIEEALILGATPKEASHHIINDAFDQAIMPTLNSMLGMGIIFLPGMMTGQILSGTAPTTAILYQIAVMLGILGGVSLSTFIFLKLSYKTYFNHHAQLIK